MWFNMFLPFITDYDLAGKKLNKFQNDIEFQNNFVNLVNLATYVFKWNNLPSTCNERFLELCLLLNGRACMVKDNDMGYLTLKASNTGSELNIYGEYDKIFAYGYNGFFKEYTAYLEGGDNSNANGVICRDNNLAYPYYYYIILGAKRLTNSIRSIDVASQKLKTPYFITCDESQVKSVEKIINDIEGNKNEIITSKSTMPDMFKVLPTSVDTRTVDVLWNTYNNYDNLIKTILGIDSCTNKDKKERLLVDEVNADSIVSDINVLSRLKMREKFCKQVNELFGLNISVSLNEEIINGDDKEYETGRDNETDTDTNVDEE